MDYGSINNEEPRKKRYSIMDFARLFAFSFTNGLLMATYPIATLPTEAGRIDREYKTIILAGLLTIAGITQLSGPVAGLYSDRSTNPRGRRRPYMKIASVFGFIGLSLQLVGSHYENWILYTIAFTESILCLNVIFATMIGLVSDLVLPEQTGVANGVITMLNALGALTGFGVWFLAKGNTQIMYVAYNATVVLSIWITSLAPVVEPPLKSAPRPTVQDIRNCFWVSPVLHRDFFLVFIGRTLYYMGISSTSMFLYYLRDIIHTSDPQQHLALMAVIGLAGGALTSYPAGQMSDSLGNGRKIYVYVSCVAMALGMLCLIVVRTLPTLYLVVLLNGAAQGVYGTMDYCLAIDTLPDPRKAARYMGIWGVGAFVGATFGPMIAGPSLFFAGKTSTHGVFSNLGYSVVWILGANYLLLSALVVKFIKGTK